MSAACLHALLQHRFRAVQHGDAGFTVLEAVVALTMFVAFATAATLAVAGGITANSDTRNRVAASNIAQGDLEQARALPTPSAATYTTSAPGDSARYTVTRTVSMPTPSASDPCPPGKVMTISVTVTGPGVQGVTIESVLAC